MLEKIAKLDAAVVRALLVAVVGLIGTVLSFFGIDEAAFGEKGGRLVDGISTLLIAAGVFWAMYARINQPTPPLSDNAVAKTQQLIAQGKLQETKPPQGGFVRPLMLAFLLGLAVPMVAMVSGCAGTRAAYQEAQSPDEYAFVITEHYAALVKEAADLKERPTTPREAVEAMQRAELAARPLILGGDRPPSPGLRDLAETYSAVRDAKSEQDLQLAIDRAVLKIADLVRAVKAARGGT